MIKINDLCRVTTQNHIMTFWQLHLSCSNNNAASPLHNLESRVLAYLQREFIFPFETMLS